MPTKKPTKKKVYTPDEAAREKGVTRAAIDQAIRKGRLEWEWGEVTQTQIIRKKVRLIPAESLKTYHVDTSRQERGKKS